jgi:hypothetical protein
MRRMELSVMFNDEFDRNSVCLVELYCLNVEWFLNRRDEPRNASGRLCQRPYDYDDRITLQPQESLDKYAQFVQQLFPRYKFLE